MCSIETTVFAIGGCDGEQSIADCEYYNGVEWKEMKSMTRARRGVKAVAVGTIIYAIGGHDGTDYVDVVEVGIFFNSKLCRNAM